MKYLISYDLRNPDRDYQKLYDKLDQLDAVGLLGSVWIVDVDEKSAERVLERLRRFIDKNDRLLIVRFVKNNLAGWNLTGRLDVPNTSDNP